MTTTGLYPTKTRLALLAAARRGDVWYDDYDGIVWLDEPDGSTSWKVTARYRELGEDGAGWLTKGEVIAERCRLYHIDITAQGLEVLGVPACGLTHDEHMAVWKSWRDDCDVCGFAVQDVEQCRLGHPDDGCTECGACGHGMPWGTARQVIES